MLLFCSTMHFASGRVRRKTFQFVAGDRCFFRKFSSNRTGRSQNCVSPVNFPLRLDEIFLTLGLFSLIRSPFHYRVW